MEARVKNCCRMQALSCFKQIPIRSKTERLEVAQQNREECSGLTSLQHA